MDVTIRLAEWTANWSGEASERAQRWARNAIYDTIGCIIAGAGDTGASRIRTAISGWGSGGASIAGSTELVAAPWAALANGASAHALDYDDNIHYAMTHASAVILPALLALGEEINSRAADIINAWLVGIEIQIAVGHGVNRLHYDNGWHATSTVGTIGTAAACARLLGLDQVKTANAISLGFSMASGTKAQFGTMAKAFHAGMAAKNAVIAARLAEAGIEAAPEPLDSQYGFRSLYVGPASRGWEGVLDGLGNPLAVEKYGLEPKRYPCCAGAHRALDGLLELQAKHGFNAEDVEGIRTLVGWGNASSLLYPEPQQEMEARFSMQYCIAAALLGRGLRLSDFVLSAIHRPEARRLFPLITMETHPRDDAEAPAERKPAEIAIRLKGGRVLHTMVQHARGTMFRPFTDEELDEKFRDCAEGLLPPKSYAVLRDQLPVIEQLSSIRPLMRQLRFSAGCDRGERFLERPYRRASAGAGAVRS